LGLVPLTLLMDVRAQPLRTAEAQLRPSWHYQVQLGNEQNWNAKSPVEAKSTTKRLVPANSRAMF